MNPIGGPPPLGGVDLGIDGLEEAHEIGRGGFGTVYRAREPSLNRYVAVKVMARVGGANPARFAREAWALGTLSGHPNIVSVIRAGSTASGLPYIVMPYLALGSFADLVARSGPLPWPEAVRVGIRLAGALETAHRAGALHRDVKPENVLRSDYGEPQLADFGLARMSGVYQTTTGRPTFTVTHAPPEILSGAPASVAADVYSLASTLHVLLAGQAPFHPKPDEALASLFMRITRDPPPDLRPMGIPDAVCTVLEAALAKDPAARPTSAADFAARLREAEHQAGVPVTSFAASDPPAAHAPPFPPPPRVASPAPADTPTEIAVPPTVHLPRRRAWLRPVVLGSVAGVLVLAVAFVLLAMRGPSGPGPADLDEPTGVAVDAAGAVYIADTAHSRIQVVDATGEVRTFAGTGAAGYSGDNGPATAALLGHPEAVTVGPDGAVYVADTDNGVVRRIMPDGVIETVAAPEDTGLYASALVVGEDGSIYVAHGEQVVRLLDGQVEIVAGGEEPGFGGDGGPAAEARLDTPSGLALAADGTLYISDTGNHRVRLVAQDGTITTFAGNSNTRLTGDGGPALDAGMNSPAGLAFDMDGNLYVAEYGNNVVRRIDQAGTITTVVGDGEYGFAGDGGPATDAWLDGPAAVAAAPDGSLYIADYTNDRVRRVAPTGEITTVG